MKLQLSRRAKEQLDREIESGKYGFVCSVAEFLGFIAKTQKRNSRTGSRPKIKPIRRMRG